MTRKQVDKEIVELRIKLIQTSGYAMDLADFNTKLQSTETYLVNHKGIIIGLLKEIHEKEDDTLVYLFEVVQRVEGDFRITVKDKVRGLSTHLICDNIGDVDKILINNNPYRTISYMAIGDDIKKYYN